MAFSSSTLPAASEAAGVVATARFRVPDMMW